MENKKYMFNRICRFILLAFTLLPSFVFAGGMPPAIVQIENAASLEIAPFVWVSGTVIGRYDSKIAAEVEGVLENVLEVGERVNQGDNIANIDDTKYQLALNEIDAEIMPIKTMAEFFRKEAARLNKLAKKNNAAKNQLDLTQANHDEAIAKIKIIKAKLAMAHDDLQKSVVRAPFSGVVTERYKSPGERVDAGEEVVRLINTEEIEVQTRIPQDSFKYVNVGDSLSVKAGTEEIKGTVRTTIPVGDDVSRLYEIRVGFNHVWPAGTAVQVASPVSHKQTVIAVRRDALVIRQSGVVVYRINNDNQAELVPVKTGIANTTHIQVIGDVNENDRIVIRGNERLRPGQTVQVMDGINK